MQLYTNIFENLSKICISRKNKIPKLAKTMESEWINNFQKSVNQSQKSQLLKTNQVQIFILQISLPNPNVFYIYIYL